jgi:pimeloyl-ACP methyl ester carboxylesterase
MDRRVYIVYNGAESIGVKSMSRKPEYFFPTLLNQAALLNYFDGKGMLGLVSDVAYRRDYADIPEQPGESVPYVRLFGSWLPEFITQEDDKQRTIFYVPGFTESVAAKAPLGLALAELGHDVIMPDQNRSSGILRDRTGSKNATFTQAAHLLSVIGAEGLTETPLDFVTHSYGSSVFNVMVHEAAERGWTCFNDARAVMIAPSGMSEEKQLPYTARFLKDIVSTFGSKKEIKDYAFGIAFRNLFRDFPRSTREVFEMRKRKIDVAKMKEVGKISLVHVLSPAEDKLYPSGHTAKKPWNQTVAGKSIPPYLESAEIDGWSVPVTLDEGLDYGGQHAEHNDEQYYPRRSAAAVHDVLVSSSANS